MKQTRHSLLTSATALLLCFVMLIGTTFAWFTDEVTSSSNVIQTGTLDIGFEWSTEQNPLLWNNAEFAYNQPIFTANEIWEPGHTQVRYLRVRNLGSLAFKYEMFINPTGEVGTLAEVIDVSWDIVTDNENFVAPTAENKSGSLNKVGTLADLIGSNKAAAGGVLLPEDVTEDGYYSGEIVICISFHMQETAGNDYQDQSIGDSFGINLYATQFDYENDSFDNSYDDEAQWPVIPSAGNSASADVQTDENGYVLYDVIITGDGMSALIPAGTLLSGDDVNKLTLSVSNKDKSDANVTLGADEELRALDVHIDNFAEDNTVPAEITLYEALPTGLNIGNYSLHHVEDGATVEMTLLGDGATPVHNNFTYDPATGDVTLYLTSYSEVALVAEEAKWEGGVDHTWYDASKTELTIANADQLWSFSQIVGGMAVGVTYPADKSYDTFAGKTITLISDIDLDDAEDANKGYIFYPIGYYNNEGTYERLPVEDRKDPVSSGLRIFEGTFDGNGHTIANFYHNTWEMKGDHNWYDTVKEQYYRDGMGLFGRVYGGTIKNLTVKNFSSDGEIATTGVIAAYADGATFENIAIFNCNPRVYNIGNGGIVGCVGWYAKEAGLTTTFKNITVDNSNTISALWGSYDVACGGIVGQYYPTSGQSSANYPVNAGISFDNCHISAQMDVYNDVCANYQYYAYRYAGMLIGSVRENVTIDGHSYPKMDKITAENCTVHFGTWNDYYYCEIIDNTTASYTHDYQMSRLTEIKAIDGTTITYLDGTTGTVPASGRANYVIVDYSKGHGTENATCYHFKDGKVWNHEDAGYHDGTDGGKIIDENGDGTPDLREDKQHLYLEFNNLVTGYGWGVTSKWVGQVAGVNILDRADGGSIEKFEGKVDSSLENNKIYTLGEIFKYNYNGVELKPQALNVSITNLDENNPVSATIVYGGENWEDGTIIFTGEGKIQITIQDYYFCIPTTITVEVKSHEHKYDNSCDTDCNTCGEERNITHTYTPAVTAPTCTEGGYTTYTCSECGNTYTDNATEALGHDYNVVVTSPTCTAGGYTTYTCSVCGHSYVADEVAATDHSYNAAVTAPTCTNGGYTTYTCACGDSYVADEVAATGHNYNAVVTAPTCTEAGYTTHTCACGDTYTDTMVAALGHIETKFTGDFLYRVGNQNAVQLSSLFNVGTRIVTVTVTNVAGNAFATVTDTSIQFSGTGVVTVTLSTDDCTCGECVTELRLEVVDAKNITSAESATANSVVLLNDAGFGSLEVSGGYTLFGNGFTLTCGSDSAALDMGYAFVTLNNGTLDNVQIVTPNFDYAVLYKSNMTDSGNRSETTDRTRYFNVKSGVMVSGNSQILNSRISGARAAVNVTAGNCVIDNSRIELGAVASLLIGAANSVTLRDVTLVQKPTASTYNPSKILMGFSVLVMCNEGGVAAPITLEGTLVQDAWVVEEYKKYVPEEGQSIVQNALKKTSYLHDLDGDGTKESLNLGVAYMPADGETRVEQNNVKISDNRSDKKDIPYTTVDVSLGLSSTYTQVYSYESTNGTDGSFKNVPEYVPNKYGDIITVNYSDTNENRILGKVYGENGWVYQLSVDLDQGAYTFDFSKLTVWKNGLALETGKSDKVSVEEGTTQYTLTLSDGSTIIFKLIGTATTKEAPKWSNDANGTGLSTTMNASWGAGLCVAASYGGKFSGAAPALVNVYVRYYSTDAKAYKVINLADYTPTTKGTFDGTDTSCTITGPDFTLTLTGGQVHSSNQINAMPVVIQEGSSYTLYFVASSSNGLVNSGNTARSVPVSYTFTDSLGNTLTGSHTWSVAENKNDQYKYSDFCNGTKTKLEKSCVTSDTLVMLADGTQKRIDQVTYDDQLLVWNFYTGKYDVAPASIVMNHGYDNYTITALKFSDGTEIKTINGHGFFDVAANKYVILSDENVADYIGHEFVKADGDGYSTLTLVDYEIYEEYTESWSILTAENYNCILEGMWTITPAEVEGSPDYLMPFDVNDDMKYDEAAMQADIEKYGLYTYGDFAEYMTEEQFAALGLSTWKVAVGKGYITWDEILYLISIHIG